MVDKMTLIEDQHGELAAYDKIQAAARLCLSCMWTESLLSVTEVYNEFRVSLDLIETESRPSLD